LAASLAAVPGCLAELAACASAYMSGTVTSQATGLPLDCGRMVEPLGRLPLQAQWFFESMDLGMLQGTPDDVVIIIIIIIIIIINDVLIRLML